MTPKEKKSNLKVDWLRENMAYDPSTGIFAWSKPGYGRTVGKPIGSKMVGSKQGNSYLAMKIDGTIFYAHRVAWFYVKGVWPNGTIDHIDGDPSNNRIANLREATSAQNAARRSTTRMIGPSRGVFPHGAGFVARLHHGGVRHYLGYFDTAEKAQSAYETKAKQIHGEFAHAPEKKRGRGDWMNALACEACGSEDRVRLDRTRIGTPRGKLCLECWGIVLTHEADAKKVHKRASQVIAYINRLDVKEEIPDGVGLVEYLAEHRPDILAEVNRNMKR